MKTLRTLVSTVAALLLLAGVPLMAQYAPSAGSALSRVAGRFVASNYNYPPTNAYIVGGGTSATGSGSIQVATASIKLPDGRAIYPFNLFSPIIVGQGSTQELVTPTAISNCYNLSTGLGSCTVTATFTYAHGNGESIVSGTGGAAEAAYDAFLAGGGLVVVDGPWAAGINTGCSACNASASAALTSMLVFPTVGIEDDRGMAPAYWSPLPSTATFLAAPTTLVSGTASSSTTVTGSASFTGGTIHVCIAYVDIMGNEGPCSADYSFTDTSAKAIQFSAPAASAGAVGWIPYIGLESGAAGNEYQTLLVTQPTALGVLPVGNGVCTLTTLETITPACAVANTLYGQATSGTINVATYPVVTSLQAVQLGGVSTTSYYAPNTNAHTTYAYVPGAHPGLTGVVTSSEPFTVSAALASTVPFVLGTIALPPGFMNVQGKTIQVCGHITDAAADVDTITAVQFWWDAQGSNVTTGIPVKLANDQITQTLTASTNRDFCQKFITTVASASATGGTIFGVDGWLSEGQVAAGTIHALAPNITTAAVGSLNLAENARMEIVFVETTSTVDTPKLQNVTVQVLN